MYDDRIYSTSITIGAWADGCSLTRHQLSVTPGGVGWDGGPPSYA